MRGGWRQYRLLLNVVLDYREVEGEVDDARFDIVATGYSYQILGPDERELLVYHWHPIGQSTVTSPHLHLSSRVRPIELGRGLDAVAFAEMHIPTGRVRFADVVRLPIAAFGVAPRRGDWEEVLAAED